MKELRLEGKTAVITGAASGIGKEIALLFAENGASVALLDMDKTKLAELESNSTKAFCADITNEDQVKDVFTQIDAAFGRIDILINCAGIFAAGKVTETDFAVWKRILGVNLDGAFLCAKYAAAAMLRAQKGGAIVNIASEAGIAAIAGQTAYNVSKAAVISLSQCMAVDYALDNIRVNCVCPGRVLTPLVQHIIDTSANPAETKRELSCDRPVMRMGDPKDIAYACLHFADNSMPYATGAVLSVDGGYTAR
jgi:NAD(P)-dependent dehydrogenase (short-subunit alcohol dehydrogenase family)